MASMWEFFKNLPNDEYGNYIRSRVDINNINHEQIQKLYKDFTENKVPELENRAADYRREQMVINGIEEKQATFIQPPARPGRYRGPIPSIEDQAIEGIKTPKYHHEIPSVGEYPSIGTYYSIDTAFFSLMTYIRQIMDYYTIDPVALQKIKETNPKYYESITGNGLQGVSLKYGYEAKTDYLIEKNLEKRGVGVKQIKKDEQNQKDLNIEKRINELSGLFGAKRRRTVKKSSRKTGKKIRKTKMRKTRH